MMILAVFVYLVVISVLNIPHIDNYLVIDITFNY